MIGVGIAFVVIGLVFLFIIPWVGLAVGMVGLVLATLWSLGFGRGAASRGERTADRRT
jgi:hypothetical protein